MAVEPCGLHGIERIHMDEPMVCVLTPVHNTDLMLLKRALDSLRAQSFGFGEMEWIVLLHNCEEAYRESARQLLDSFENIVIAEENRPGTGLGFARARLLERANGKYIFFLDSDDEFTPHCVRRAVEAMEATGADMAAWSALCRFGAGNLILWCDIDPKNRDTLLEKGDPRMGRQLAYSGIEIWSRCFRRSFLEKKGLRIEETFPRHTLGTLFNLDATLAADRVVVLPDLVGYVYYFGDGMLRGGGYEFASNAAALVDRYRSRHRRAGLMADSLMQFVLMGGVLSLWQSAPKEVRSGFGLAVKEAAGWLEPPRMNWPYLQKTAESYYKTLLGLARNA